MEPNVLQKVCLALKMNGEESKEFEILIQTNYGNIENMKFNQLFTIARNWLNKPKTLGRR